MAYVVGLGLHININSTTTKHSRLGPITDSGGGRSDRRRQNRSCGLL